MKRSFVVLMALCFLFAFGCKNNKKDDLSVLVFITGVIAGSPTYELMADGANEFAKNNQKINIKIYEAGMNQAEWEQHLSEMVSTGEYDIVLGSNPSLPEICANVAKNFPRQKFIITDAFYEGNQQIKTYLYNQYEQSFMLGYLAGLVTTSAMPNANSLKRVGFIAAQEYPLLNRQMVPGFLDGARLVDPEIELDRRIIGSWGDPNKAAELASAMMETGVDVFTAIAGGSAQGMIRTAIDRGAYIVWYNTNGYNLAPGLVVGCGTLEQKKLVMEILGSVLEDKIEYGEAETLGIKEGYIDFIFNDPYFQNALPAEIRDKMSKFMDDFRSGRINYTIPPL
jgi:simple sugar transport system substrate-binding protein